MQRLFYKTLLKEKRITTGCTVIVQVRLINLTTHQFWFCQFDCKILLSTLGAPVIFANPVNPFHRRNPLLKIMFSHQHTTFIA